MTIVHIVTPEEPRTRGDIASDLGTIFKQRRYQTLMRHHDAAQYQPAGAGVAGEDYLKTPDVVIIDGTSEFDEALRTARAYQPFVSRIVMLTSPLASPAFLEKCSEAGVAIPMPVVAATPTTASYIAGFITNTLAIGQSGGQATNDKHNITFDGGWLNTSTMVLTGPTGNTNLTGEQSRMLEALLKNPGTTMPKPLLHALADCGEDTEVKIVDVIACRLRKALTIVGLNGGKGKDDMIGTIWGKGYVFNEGATRPTTTPGEEMAANPDELAA